MDIKENDRIWFAAEKKPYRVRAANDRFVICTKPYNFMPETVLYTIIDFERNVRGMDNMVFPIYDYYHDEDCHNALNALISGEMEVSHRNSKKIPLDIIDIKK